MIAWGFSSDACRMAGFDRRAQTLASHAVSGLVVTPRVRHARCRFSNADNALHIGVALGGREMFEHVVDLAIGDTVDVDDELLGEGETRPLASRETGRGGPRGELGDLVLAEAGVAGECRYARPVRPRSRGGSRCVDGPVRRAPGRRTPTPPDGAPRRRRRRRERQRTAAPNRCPRGAGRAATS